MDLFKQIQEIRKVLMITSAERISEFSRSKTEIVAPLIPFVPPQTFVELIREADRLIKKSGECVEKSKAYALLDKAKRQLFRALDFANVQTLQHATVPENRILILQAQSELAMVCFLRQDWWDEARNKPWLIHSAPEELISYSQEQLHAAK